MYSLTKQQRQAKEGKKIGVALTIAFHVVLLFVLGITGFKLIYPPPAEKGILLEIPIEEVPRKAVPKKAPEPRAPEADPKKDVNIVQKAKAPLQSDKSNAGKPTTAQGKGDVEIPEPKREIDKRALFPSADNKKDTKAAQTAEKVENDLKAGHSKGNTDSGKLNGIPSVKLEGRSTLGSLPLPAYTVNESGTVVVKIIVNEKGEVTNAIPGQKGTTTNNSTLWNAAKQAALKARFSPSDAPTQVGYITYIFTLK
ncbi:MAG: TonB family protein [Bacteroidales bacterium]|nr:TonB family protein [Bacteroidales bacterium]